MITPQMEEYLEAIGRLEERGDPVTTSALARECRVAAPTVTEMLRRLSEQGLVSHAPRKGVSLTASGRDLASTVLRRHRLWERFLHDVLGLRWDQLHAEACELEHATSPHLEEHLAQAVGASGTCPHGHTIPGRAAEGLPGSLVPLTDLLPGQQARIVSVREEEGSLLRRLATQGIRPGVVVEVEEAPPQGGLFALAVDGRRRLLPRDVATQVTASTLSEEADGGASMPLAALGSGQSAVVHGYRAGKGLVSRCLALGFTPGAVVTMVQNHHEGPVIVLVRDTRVALGRGEAQRILVVRKEADHGEGDALPRG